MKAKLLCLSLITVLVGIFTSCLSSGRTESAERKLSESAKRSEYVFRQFLNADRDEAKQSMVEHIEYLDRLSSESGDKARNPFAADAVTWGVRPAKLEEENHASGAEYIRNAVARCERLGHSACSEGDLRRQVDRMDARPSLI